MPIYDYLCSVCDHRADILHGINDPGPQFCPSCGAEATMRKQFAVPAIHFKGSGWAKKDRGGSSSTRAAASGSRPGDAKGAKGGESATTTSKGAGSSDSGDSGGGSGGSGDRGDSGRSGDSGGGSGGSGGGSGGSGDRGGSGRSGVGSSGSSSGKGD
ncbi:MAG: FmdB family zinc ribbon protein [Candidatus Limnocylindrales bacterium]